MMNDHKDYRIFVRETCWATASTICSSVNTLVNVYVDLLFFKHIASTS